LTAVTLLGFNIGLTCNFAKALIWLIVRGGFAGYPSMVTTVALNRDIRGENETKLIMPNNSNISGTKRPGKTRRARTRLPPAPHSPAPVFSFIHKQLSARCDATSLAGVQPNFKKSAGCAVTVFGKLNTPHV
jgi:hypothetical protein